MREVQQFPEFSWSFSRASTLNSCPRKYYYAYYGSHNGWLLWRDDIPEIQKRTYRLKKLVSLPIVFGQIVHDQVERVLGDLFESGFIPTIDELEHLTRDHLNEAYLDSVKREQLWLERPSRHLMLAEIYYNKQLPKDEVAHYNERIRPTWEHFLRSETWQLLLTRGDELSFEQVEDFASIMIGDVRVWVVLDLLLYDQREDLWYIIDWKTGKRSDDDRMQLVLYAYYVAETFGVPFERIRLRNEYLQTGETSTFTPTEMDRKQLIHFFSHSVEDMRHYQKNKATNEPVAIDSFPKTEQSLQCQYCNYREVCLPSL